MDCEFKYCETCLSTDRATFPVAKHFWFTKVIAELSITELCLTEATICWECLHTILKFHRFRLRAVAAQTKIGNLKMPPKLTPLDSMSTIKRSANVEYHEYVPSNDPLYEDDLTDSGKVQIGDDKDDDGTHLEDVKVFEVDDLKVKVEPVAPSTSNGIEPNRRLCSLSNARNQSLNDDEKLKNSISAELTVEDMLRGPTDQLREHTKSEHAVQCTKCGRKFKGPDTLRSHMRRTHTIKREFTCDICSQSFRTKSRLETHLTRHNSSLAQQLAYCQTCKVQYKNIFVYRNHLRTSAHHAEDTHKCRECDKRFASKVYLKKHYNFYHLHKSQYRCDQCNKLFISQWRLNNHKATQHGEARARNHKCNVCAKRFFTQSTLKNHQLTHSEKRSFMCEDCGDTFRQRPALYTHCRLVHRGLKRAKRVETA